MNNETHKTIRVLATMETDLSLSINVPIDTDEDDIWKFIRDGNIDSGNMFAHDGLLDGGWRWQEPIYDYKFDPKAKDYSKEILKS
tara:strand:+ start:534 stop:788 length:255 start_codon:yes stop_codon:yes gene_type:complete